MGRGMSELLDEPFAPAALVLTEQHGAEFGELDGAVLENAKDRFQRGDGERQNLRFPVVAVLEPFCCVVESGVSESAGDLRAPAAEQPGRSPREGLACLSTDRRTRSGYRGSLRRSRS